MTQLICDSVVFDFSNTSLNLSSTFESGSDSVNLRPGRTWLFAELRCNYNALVATWRFLVSQAVTALICDSVDNELNIRCWRLCAKLISIQTNQRIIAITWKKSVASSSLFLHRRASLVGTGTTLHTTRRINKRGCLDEEIPLLLPNVTLPLVRYFQYSSRVFFSSHTKRWFLPTPEIEERRGEKCNVKWDSKVNNQIKELKWDWGAMRKAREFIV